MRPSTSGAASSEGWKLQKPAGFGAWKRKPRDSSVWLPYWRWTPGAQGSPRKKFVEPAECRLAVRHVVETHGYYERRACKLMDIDRRTYRRVPAPDRNADLRIRLKELAEERRRFGRPRLLTLLRREGWVVNHKRVERVYRQEGLSLRQRRRLT